MLPTEDGAEVTLEGLQDDTLDLCHWLAQELFAGVTQQFPFCHHLHLDKDRQMKTLTNTGTTQQQYKTV